MKARLVINLSDPLIDYMAPTVVLEDEGTLFYEIALHAFKIASKPIEDLTPEDLRPFVGENDTLLISEIRDIPFETTADPEYREYTRNWKTQLLKDARTNTP